MEYIVEITGPDGNGWYEPIFNDGWSIKDRTHLLNKVNPIPLYLIENLIDWLDRRFFDGYTVTVRPYKD